MAGTREVSKVRLAAIRGAEAEGSLGPFANASQPDNDEKLSPLKKMVEKAKKVVTTPEGSGAQILERKREISKLHEQGDV